MEFNVTAKIVERTDNLDLILEIKGIEARIAIGFKAIKLENENTEYEGEGDNMRCTIKSKKDYIEALLLLMQKLNPAI